MHSPAIASLRRMDWVMIPRYEAPVALSARGYVSTRTMLYSEKICFYSTNNHLGGRLDPPEVRLGFEILSVLALLWLQSDLQYNNVDEKRKCKM